MHDYTAEIKSFLKEPGELSKFKDEKYREMNLLEKGDFLEFLSDIFKSNEMEEFILSNTAIIGNTLGVDIKGLDGDNLILSVKSNIINQFAGALSL